MTERFIEALAEKQEAITTDVLKQHPYPSDFQIFGFNSGKYDLNMVKECFVEKVSYNNDDECNEDVFATKKENDYMFLTTSKFKFLDVRNYI